MAPVGDVMHLGLFTELWLINGTGSVGLDGGGTSAKFGAIATADLRGTPTSSSHVPLRFSANVVYSLDNTGAVLQDTETARGEPVTRIERYGLGVNRVDHFDFLLGGEAFIADERVRPFIEGRILTPNNRQNYACHVNNPSQDNCLANDTVVPSTLTLGSRFFPWKRGFSLLAAFDIGLGGTHDFIEELQPVAPVDALSRRRLGGRHLGPAAGRQEGRAGRRARHARAVTSSGSCTRRTRTTRSSARSRPTAIDRTWPPLPPVPTASSATRWRRAPIRTISRPTATRPAAATRTSLRREPR